MRVLFIIIILGSGFCIKAQINNYWSMGSNTSSSLLGGAVVGGEMGTVAIFYNPAGIEVEDQKQLALNVSLVNFNLHLFDNAVGSNRNLDYLEWGIVPRFISYQFNLKKNKRLSFQIAVFSRDEKLVELFDQQTAQVTSSFDQKDYNYTASYDFERRYTDYWFGIGASYYINSKFSVGATIFGSGKSLRYYQSSTVNLEQTANNIGPTSTWASMEKQYFYVVSVIPKLGFLYRLERFSFGMNFSFPSMRLYGDGYAKRSLQYSEIVYNGQPQDDYLNTEFNNHIVANVKEPFSVSIGATFTTFNEKTKYYFSAEYFAPLATYKILNNKEIADYYEDDYQPGTDFLSYKYGAKEVFNVAVGIRHSINESYSVLTGFKTNFSSYEVSHTGEWSDISEYVDMNVPMFHMALGLQFRFLANTFIVGTEYAFGTDNEGLQLANYGYPGVFDKNQHLALQNYQEHTMVYSTNSLGFYIGYSLDF